jgi:amino acid transporter
MDFTDKDEKHSLPSDNATEIRSTGNQDVNEGEIVTAGSQHLHRKLRGKEVQLFAVGGAIGTCTSTSD